MSDYKLAAYSQGFLTFTVIFGGQCFRILWILITLLQSQLHTSVWVPQCEDSPRKKGFDISLQTQSPWLHTS